MNLEVKIEVGLSLVDCTPNFTKMMLQNRPNKLRTLQNGGSQHVPSHLALG